MTSDTSTRLVRFPHGDETLHAERLKSPILTDMERPELLINDSGGSGSSAGSHGDLPSVSLDTNLHPYYDSTSHTTPFSSFDGRTSVTGLAPKPRTRSGS